MTIEIKADKGRLTIGDEGLDNDAFVTVTIVDNMSGDAVALDVSLHDLMPALIAFDAKRSKRLSEEEMLCQ